MIQSLLAHKNLILVVGGASLAQFLLAPGMGATPSSARAAPSSAPDIPDFAMPFVDIVGKDAITNICKDQIWLELCDRAGEYSMIAKDDFADLLVAVASVAAFDDNADVYKKRARPRMFRENLHRIVEAIRNMHATIEEGHPECMNDFDELAAEFQRVHDDYALNCLLESRT